MSEAREIAEAIVLSTTFERDQHGDYTGGFVYARDDNPNRRALERALAELEGGADAAAFASGSAAAAALFQTLRPGDHTVVADDCYYSIRVMLDEIFVPWGLAVSYADTSDLDALRAAMRAETRLVFIETPSNPLMRITDIAGAAAIAHEHGAVLACDNTLATPVLQRPIVHGADVVAQSTTKYIAGHHDAMGGALIAARDDAAWSRVRSVQRLCGAVPSPFAAWLTLRGISSLTVRVRAQHASAVRIARHLAGHPEVHDVLHPDLPAHPAHATAARQSEGSGALFSIRVRGEATRALDVAARLRRFRRATSFGGHDSLVEHRASIEGVHSLSPPDLLRLAIGLEDTDALIADLDAALAR